MKSNTTVTVVKTEDVRAKSLFNLFIERKTVLAEIFNTINPANAVAAKDVEIVDLSSSATEGFCDIGFLAKDKLIIITELTSDSIQNTAARMLLHTSAVYRNLIEMDAEKLYGTEKLQLPMPEFYAFYVGGGKFDECSDHLFDDKSADFKITVKAVDGKSFKNSSINAYCNLLECVEENIAEGFNKAASIKIALKESKAINPKDFNDFISEREDEVISLLKERLDRKDYFEAKVLAGVTDKVNDLENKFKDEGKFSTLTTYVASRRKHACSDEKILNELINNFGLDAAEAGVVLAADVPL